jgi:hypothetical protein
MECGSNSSHLAIVRAVAIRLTAEKLPKLPLVNPNTLNWRDLTKTGFPAKWKWWKTERILAYPIETTWGSNTGGLPGGGHSNCGMHSTP